MASLWDIQLFPWYYKKETEVDKLVGKETSLNYSFLIRIIEKYFQFGCLFLLLTRFISRYLWNHTKKSNLSDRVMSIYINHKEKNTETPQQNNCGKNVQCRNL